MRPAESLDDLVLAVGRGDQAAFTELYDAVAPRIYGLALRVLRDPHQSEEVAQEVFIQLWQCAGSFDPSRGSALAYLMTLAHRRAVDRVRSAEASRRRDSAHHEIRDRTLSDETAETAHASLSAQAVRHALTSLSPHQRRAIELAYFGGHTYQEVSRLLQIPLGTAKGRIRDGLLRLRDLLAVGALEAG